MRFAGENRLNHVYFFPSAGNIGNHSGSGEMPEVLPCHFFARIFYVPGTRRHDFRKAYIELHFQIIKEF
jgi:hypothetical protein